MRLLAVAGFLLLLASVPGARAAPSEDELEFTLEYVKLTQVERDAVLVEDQVVVSNPGNESYAGTLTFFVPRGATDLEWRFASVGQATPSNAPRDSHAVVGSEGTFDLVALDLGAEGDSIPAGNASYLTFSYHAAAREVGVRFSHDVGNAVIQAIALAGQKPESDDVSFTQFQGAESIWIAEGATTRSYDEGDTFTVRFVDAPAAASTGGDSLRDNLAWVLIGALSGAFLIGALVKTGVLRIAPQRTRAQAVRSSLAGVAQETLEARKRAMMAALKELDMAHRSGEVPAAAYAPLKAELMEEAVRVTRELERRSSTADATPENRP